MRKILVAFTLALALWFGSGPSSAQHNTQLGASLFWATRGLQSYTVQLDQNLRWIKNNLGADYVRVFMVLGGDEFPASDGNRYDPWRDASILPINVVFESWVARTTDHIYDNYGLKVHWTIIGSDFHSVSRANLDTYADHFALQIRSREHKVFVVEAWNEYNINGGDVADLQYLGRRLRANLGPSFPIALSSPGATHTATPESQVLAEIGAMYAGPDFGGASIFTYHSSRPVPRWGPAAMLRLLGASVPRLNGEPRGPGASAGGDVSDPSVLAGDYRDSISAGEIGWTFHTAPGVWGGHAYGFPDQNRWRNLWEVTNAEAIATRLKALRAGNAAPNPGPGPVVPTPPGPVTPPADPIAVLLDLVRRVQVLEGIARQAGYPIPQ